MPTFTLLTTGYVKGGGRVAGTVSLIQAEGVAIIADPGMVASRDLILEPLRSAGLTPEEVTHVFISHHHPDHTVNIALFPNAIVVDFWASYENDLWTSHDDHYEIAPGVMVLRTPGHTEEDASLMVETDDGVYALTYLWWHADMTPEVDPLAWDQKTLEASRELILEQADWIVPGHGEVFKNPRR